MLSSFHILNAQDTVTEDFKYSIRIWHVLRQI